MRTPSQWVALGGDPPHSAVGWSSVDGDRWTPIDPRAQRFELRGDAAHKINRAYGTTGIITELELPLAPTQSEPPFLAAQGIVLALFVIAGFIAVRTFRPSAA